MLYCRETAGDGFVNFFDDANCESASDFEVALEVVGSAKMLPLMLYEECDVSDVSEAECLFLANFMWTEWGHPDLLGRKSIIWREVYWDETNPDTYLDDS
jgi:hypothetical protein